MASEGTAVDPDLTGETKEKDEPAKSRFGRIASALHDKYDKYSGVLMNTNGIPMPPSWVNLYSSVWNVKATEFGSVTLSGAGPFGLDIMYCASSRGGFCYVGPKTRGAAEMLPPISRCVRR